MSKNSTTEVRGTIYKVDSASTTPTKESHPDDIKFGITTPFRESDVIGELVLLPHDKPISYAVATVCQIWGYPNHTDYALKFSLPPGHYVTDVKRKELSGKLVSMQYSPTKVCEDVISKISSGSEKEIVDGIMGLASKTSDPTFVNKFVGLNGVSTLLELLEKDNPVDWIGESDVEQGREFWDAVDELMAKHKEAYSYALQALLDIMSASNVVTWDKIQTRVISKIAKRVISVKRDSNSQTDSKAQVTALQALESAITASELAHAQIEKEVTLPNILHNVTNCDPNVQKSVLALINALLNKSDTAKRKCMVATLSSRMCRDIILQYVINREPGPRPSELEHELFVMQTHFLNLLEEQRQTPVNSQSKGSLAKVHALLCTAFDLDAEDSNASSIKPKTDTDKSKKTTAKRDCHSLGFNNNANPIMDFTVVPPGNLALDCIHYLATKQPETYNTIVWESIGDDCPFGRLSIALVAMLCELLSMGEPLSNEEEIFYPFIFQHGSPFQELFCICAQIMPKTWKDMKATPEDFEKVSDVLRDQIHRTLEKVPETFETLKSSLQTFTFTEITKLRHEERAYHEESKLQAKPIQDLKKKLVPEMMELIKLNRINYLMCGTQFTVRSQVSTVILGLTRFKSHIWFCRLSQNGKVLNYGDCEDKGKPPPEELLHALNVAEIRDIIIGKEVKESKDKKTNSPPAFSLVTEKDSFQTIEFIAPDERAFDLWTDGINALLGKQMTSKEAKSDLRILLQMEIKLRLIDLEGVPLPLTPPPIPKLPSSFDFSALQIGK